MLRTCYNRNDDDSPGSWHCHRSCKYQLPNQSPVTPHKTSLQRQSTTIKKFHLAVKKVSNIKNPKPKMKKNILAALAIGFAAAASASANLAPVNVNTDYYSGVQDGDLILGVRKATDAGLGTSFMVDLGQFSNLNSLGVINLSGDFATAAVFNSSSTAGLVFGVFGVQNGTIYATSANNASYPALHSSAVNTLSYGALVGGSQIFGALEDASQTTDNGVYVSSANAQSWYALSSAGFGASQFGNGALEVAAGSTAYFSSTLATVNGSGSGSVKGTFNLDSSGNLSYTAVPEPSTYALMGLGALLLIIAYRRKTA